MSGENGSSKEQTAKSSLVLASFDTNTSSLKSPRQDNWHPEPNGKVLDLTSFMNEQDTQSEPADVRIMNTPVDTAQQQMSPLDTLDAGEVVNQEQFDKKYGFRRASFSQVRVVEGCFSQVRSWRKGDWFNFVKNRVPIIEWLPSYNFRSDFFVDFVGGLMVSVMSIPQGLAYGFLVGLPPVFGIYTSIIEPIIYACLGTSRHVSPGSFAIVALMVGNVVEQMTSVPQINAGGFGTYLPPPQVCCADANHQGETDFLLVLEIVACVTLVVGLLQILMGLLNAGLLAVWLSDQLVQGLTSGAAIHVLTSQLKSMTGIPNLPPTSVPNGIVKFYICFFSNINEFQLAPTLCSAICIFLLLFSKEFLDKAFSKWIRVKIPMELLVVIFSTLFTYAAHDTEFDFGLKFVGEVNSGMYTPFLPSMRHASSILGNAFPIAIVSFVIHIALAKLISKKLDYTIDPNQEWLALGMMNSIGACFGCFAGGASLSRTMTQVKLGTKSQMSTIVCAIVLLCVVYGLSFCFYFLPQPVLSCIVVVALKDLIFQIKDSFAVFHQSIIDFFIWLVTFLAVILINVNYGLVVGVTFALLTVVLRSQWPESSFLGRIPNTCDFTGMNHYRAVEDVPGVIVYRFDAPLYFANAELFLCRIRAQLGIQPLSMAVAVNKKAEKTIAHKLKPKLTSLSEKKKGTEATPLTTPGKDEEGKHPDEFEVVFRNARMQEKPSKTEKVMQDEETPETVQLTHIIVDCSAFGYIDLMGLDALRQVFREFGALNLTVYYAACKVSIRQLFELTNFHDLVPKRFLFVSVWDAVKQALKDRKAIIRNTEDRAAVVVDVATARESPQFPSKKLN